MNHGLPDTDVTIEYYDSDYPSKTLSRFPENFDATTEYQGLRYDVDRYIDIATAIGNQLDILEICCGTGRVAIPLAVEGHRVTAVDLSAGMLDGFTAKLRCCDKQVQNLLTLVKQDATELDLGEQKFDLSIIAFNSLLCIPDFERQQRCLARIAAHLRSRGLLVIDAVNPLELPIKGSPVPTPFFTRKHPVSGHEYTRFAMSSAFDADHRQRLHGWYDEITDDSTIRRRPYSMHWRPIFRHELQMMLRQAGFEIESIEGGHRGESYNGTSPRMFVRARLS